MKRYLVCDGWDHIFLENGREKNRTTRFVFDNETNTLPILDIQRDNKWRAGDSVERADLLDSLTNANPEALEKPEDWGLEERDEVPDWN